MIIQLRWLLLLFLLPGFISAQEKKEQHIFYVSSISWHTAVIIPASAFPESLWTNEYNFSDAEFLEIGWGEADFYPAENFNIWYAVKSIFWPTSSVLHINPIYRPVGDYYYDTNVVRLEVTGEQFQALLEFLKNSFETDTTGKIIPAAEGLYPGSYFFNGKEKYFFPKNSNVWAARALRSSGFSITPLKYQTTGCLLNQADDLGDKVVEKD